MGNKAWLLTFSNDSGSQEYVVIVTDEEELEDYRQPETGFTLDDEVEIEADVSSFPTNRPLFKRPQ